MKVFSKKWAYVILSIFLGSCSLGFDTDIKVVGYYHLTAPDDDTQLGLTYCDPKDSVGGCSGIIPATVFSVGYNKNYIIAKQHPGNNRNITNYFIIPLNPQKRTWGNYFDTIGPLTRKEFESKSAELNIEAIKFSITQESFQ